MNRLFPHGQGCEPVAAPKTEFSQPTIGLQAAQLWQRVTASLLRSSQLQVWHTADAVGNIRWSAYDPQTDRAITELSETEMRAWIEQRHYPNL